jgi:MFS family permease
MTNSDTSSIETSPPTTARRVIAASTAGTVFEWYDFYLYGALAAVVGQKFFTAVSPAAALIFGLVAFSIGFVVRPIGALLFGRFGDRAGRKRTFLATILIMGLATVAVGLLPTYESIGIFAPITLISLRVLQGLAIGGEYGGAAVYIAEHSPRGKRGGYTSWLQTAATLGLLLSIAVITLCRLSMSDEAFDAWGWRIPFVGSAVLLAISVWIRLRLHESPTFLKMKAAGATAKAPIKETFTKWANLRLVLLALFGLVGGQAVVWIVAQIYPLLFLTNTLQVDPTDANIMTGVALALGVPFFIGFGYLSDRTGRKPLIVIGCLLGALTYFPTFSAITHFANPALEQARTSVPVVVVANPNECSLQFDPMGRSEFTSSCDVAKIALAERGIPYANETAAEGTSAIIRVGDREIASYSAGSSGDDALVTVFKNQLEPALLDAGYPLGADGAEINHVMVVLLLLYLIMLAAMVFGPMAAALTELFPARIRYTAMSFPYHIGNGWIGGLMPASIVAIQSVSGDIYTGLWYPVIVAGVTAVVCLVFIPEPSKLPTANDMSADVDTETLCQDSDR